MPNLDRAEELRPYRPLDADRLKLFGRAQWDPNPFLPDELWLAYQEPDSLLRPECKPDVDDMPNLQKESPQEVLKLARLWDINGLLRIRDPALPDPPQVSCMKVFNNFKGCQC